MAHQSLCSLLIPRVMIVVDADVKQVLENDMVVGRM